MNGNPMASGWYYFRPDDPGRGQVGPLEWPQLADMAQIGGLRPNDLVWHQSFPDWMQAAQVTGLFAAPKPLAAEPVQPGARALAAQARPSGAGGGVEQPAGADRGACAAPVVSYPGSSRW